MVDKKTGEPELPFDEDGPEKGGQPVGRGVGDYEPVDEEPLGEEPSDVQPEDEAAEDEATEEPVDDLPEDEIAVADDLESDEMDAGDPTAEAKSIDGEAEQDKLELPLEDVNPAMGEDGASVAETSQEEGADPNGSDEAGDDAGLPGAVLAIYPPDRDALYDLVKSRTTEFMLRRIAISDNGMDAQEQLEALERIHSGQEGPRGWVPNEVLALFRGMDFPREKYLLDPEVFHIARSFVCLALLLPPEDEEFAFDPVSLNRLLESCLVLGETFRRPLLNLLTWAVGQMEPAHPARMFTIYSLLVVASHDDATADEAVPPLAEWSVAANQAALALQESSEEPSDAFGDPRARSIRPAFRRRLKNALVQTVPEDSEARRLLDPVCDASAPRETAGARPRTERILTFLRGLRRPEDGEYEEEEPVALNSIAEQAEPQESEAESPDDARPQNDA